MEGDEVFARLTKSNSGKKKSSTTSSSSRTSAVETRNEHLTSIVNDGCRRDTLVDGAALFVAVQFVGYSIYAITVERFSVLVMPAASVMAALVFSDEWWSGALGWLRRRVARSPLDAHHVAEWRLTAQIASIMAVALLVYVNQTSLNAALSPRVVPPSHGEQQQADLQVVE